MESKRREPRSFSVLMVVLISIGILGLVACSAFFITNQININIAYQKALANINAIPSTNVPQASGNANTVGVQTIEPVEYIKALSEAQTAASTKDIISLLYGFLSSAFIAVGLNFLRESQQAAKDTRAKSEEIDLKFSEIIKKQSDIEEEYTKIAEIKTQAEKQLSSIQENLTIQGQTVLLQTYIEQATICSRSIEMLAGICEIDQSISQGMLDRTLPRIRDSLHWSVDIVLKMRTENNTIALTSKQLRVLIRGIAEIKASINGIKKNGKSKDIFCELNPTWDEFCTYADDLYQSLVSIGKTEGKKNL